MIWPQPLKNVHNKFSVKYYLNLVLVDEEDRRYFKQQEINLWRKALKPSSRAKKKKEQKDKETATTKEDGKDKTGSTPSGSES